MPKDLIHTKGFGATEPISSLPSRANENRRVEIHLLSQLEAEGQDKVRGTGQGEAGAGARSEENDLDASVADLI
jgi:hypothetical protein